MNRERPVQNNLPGASRRERALLYFLVIFIASLLVTTPVLGRQIQVSCASELASFAFAPESLQKSNDVPVDVSAALGHLQLASMEWQDLLKTFESDPFDRPNFKRYVVLSPFESLFVAYRAMLAVAEQTWTAEERQILADDIHESRVIAQTQFLREWRSVGQRFLALRGATPPSPRIIVEEGAFAIVLSSEAKEQLASIESDPAKTGLKNQTRKALRLLAANPQHPGLNSHRFHSSAGAWTSYIQNNTPAAHRMLWRFSTRQPRTLEILQIIPHY